MGYHSEVVITLSKEAKKILEEKLDNLSKEEKENIESIFSGSDAHFIHESGAELYHWEWIKWYNNYPEVAFIENFLNGLDDEGHNEDYCFLRIGEDLGDIEQQGFFYDDPFAACIACETRYSTLKCKRIYHE